MIGELQLYNQVIFVHGPLFMAFRGQEPGTNAEIKEFCSATFGVKFQMFEKISVKGEDAHPLYKWLAEKGGSEPKWNFSKYLVNEKGEVVKYWPRA
jgi:glutathione peroxidase